MRYEATVIGTGFGGAIAACRTSRRWPEGRVLVLERGKRYGMGEFPRSPHDIAGSFWSVAAEDRPRPRGARRGDSAGLFDIRQYRHIDVVQAAGFGGGSLIYANVFLEPPEAIFDERWPTSCTPTTLRPYYEVARRVLRPRPLPKDGFNSRRRVIRTELFQQVAKELGRSSKLLDISVFFGNDPDGVLPPGVQQKNRYGALQTSCLYCGECNIGCNTHSKNTVDLNYLYAAEHDHGAEIRTEALVERIVPLNSHGEPDPASDGTHGYRVHYRDLTTGRTEFVETERVIVSAGTLGSTELLLRCRDIDKSLPRLGQRLGHAYSGNGDFLAFVLDGKRDVDPNFGPVITQRIDFNLFEDFDSDRAFIMEDASYPPIVAWITEGAKPRVSWLNAVTNTVRHVYHRFRHGRSLGRIGFAFSDLLREDLSYRTSVHLCMGLDNADGKMSLDANGRLAIDWPYRKNLGLYRAILNAVEAFNARVRGRAMIPLPTWAWPLRKNVTVHSLGGCALSDAVENGVTNASPTRFGEVFAYRNLYVADGSLVPTAVGANPVATIMALSERVAQTITGEVPSDAL